MLGLCFYHQGIASNLHEMEKRVCDALHIRKAGRNDAGLNPYRGIRGSAKNRR